MRILKPPRLRTGDVIGIAAPASPVNSEEQLSRGIRYLESLGYRVALGRYIHQRHGYLAGSDRQRASDLNRFISDPQVKAIFVVRGGYGSQRLLPYIDYAAVRHHPKILVGYSDITALHLAFFTHAGLVTFAGPMVAVEMAAGLRGTVEEQFWDCLTSTAPPRPLAYRSIAGRIPRERKSSSGRIVGGNLSVLAGLMGTDFFPSYRNLVWLLEEIGERPYRIDRMIEQLALGGVIRSSRGVLLGRFSDCEPERGKPSLTLRHVFDEKFRTFSYPVGTGVQFGHYKSSRVIPWGVRVRMDNVRGRTTFLEGGVS